MDIERETGSELKPKYDANGLITVVCTHSDTGDVLMVAYANAEALAACMATKKATFWSRSRNRLWVKGEESGNSLQIVEARIDCDQDCMWLKCIPAGPACHTGEPSCFYRRIEESALIRD
jgi:phosphoribosyl-AMP cyclohydrolase